MRQLVLLHPQKEMDADTQVTLSFLFNLGPQLVRQCCLQLGWVFAPQLTLSGRYAQKFVFKMSLDLIKLAVKNTNTNGSGRVGGSCV